jgi:pyrimidine operon attenuation protein/uracil phosphoribosyltransferase
MENECAGATWHVVGCATAVDAQVTAVLDGVLAQQRSVRTAVDYVGDAGTRGAGELLVVGGGGQA